MNLDKIQLAYIAGFLDGDGCIVINYEKNSGCFLGYRVRVRISFTQISCRREVLDTLRDWISSGQVSEYQHNHMAEYMIRDQLVVDALLKQLLPFLVVKKKHAELALRTLAMKQERYSKQSLENMRVCALQLRALNNYPKKIHLDPVTTEA